MVLWCAANSDWGVANTRLLKFRQDVHLLVS